MSNLDYPGSRKTHRFPPPYGLGSLSLTHRPAENPTGVTMMLVSQGILNHAPPCSAVQNDDSFLSLELYNANRRSEVRTSEPVCRTVSGSHCLTSCERYVLSPDGERVRVRGRCLVTLN